MASKKLKASNYIGNPMGYFNDRKEQELKKAQFGWIGELTGSKYIMGPRPKEVNTAILTEKAEKAAAAAKAKLAAAKAAETKKKKG